MKKLITIILIFALMPYLTGCYGLQQATLEDVKKDNNISELTVHTRDSISYHFKKGNFSFKPDSLSGTGTKIIDKEEYPFSGNLAVKDILRINPEKQNTNKNSQGVIVVQTKNIYAYQFDEGNYLFKADTLYGEGERLSVHKEVPFSGGLAISDIIGFDAYKDNSENIAIAIISVSLVVGLIALLASFGSGMSHMFSPK